MMSFPSPAARPPRSAVARKPCGCRISAAGSRGRLPIRYPNDRQRNGVRLSNHSIVAGPRWRLFPCLAGTNDTVAVDQFRSFPRKRESSGFTELGPRFRGGERKRKAGIAAAAMSALRQVGICGLRNRDSPNPAAACKGTNRSALGVLLAKEDPTGPKSRPGRTVIVRAERDLRSPLTVTAQIKTGS